MIEKDDWRLTAGPGRQGTVLCLYVSKGKFAEK